ncbi:DUF2877 domain-containing protein [Virgibacillus sp. L01]|uniref:DUF2877 domain-containing protein n=1 Tax=Virgibacillus sp. L01 TaxID=3457429 RepID=UPI003FD2A36B
MSEKSQYKVEEYNCNIPLLFSEFNKGHVHSKFNNGFNLQIGNNLVFIGSNRGGRLPFSLLLSIDDVRDLLSAINVNDPVVWDNTKGILAISESCDIVLLEGEPYDNKLDVTPGSEQKLVNSLETFLLTMSANDEPTGINLDINDFMEHYVTYQDKTGNQYDVYYELMDSLYISDETEIESILRHFLGRGKGGTPAGDDHIIGLMAIHAVSQAWTPLFPDVLSRLIENEKITTDVSIEYLKYALNNQFGSPVIELIQSMINGNEQDIQEKIVNLLSMGHSSGLDTTFGILLGLLAIRRKING